MTDIVLDNPELLMLLNNKSSGYLYRERRSFDWKENYELYRDKVTINRLTQRQSVNIPLMKTTIRTLLKDVDEMPVVIFENLDNDKEAEVFQNEYWKFTLEDNNADVQDIVDKKQDFFFGRTFDSWQIIDGKVKFNVEDPEDILVDRFMNPYDIDSSRFLIHTHIFKPLSTIIENPDYNEDAKRYLKEYFESTMGIVKAKDNQSSLTQKNQRLADMGVTDIDNPILGETYVELTLHFCYRKEESDEQLYLYVEAEDQVILQKEKLESIIGTTQDHYWRNHFNYNTWGDDVDKQDFWSDGIADIVRTPNKVLNAWFSQMVENRTLRNLGMQFYDSTASTEFVPGSYEPKAFGWYGVPGKPSEFMQKVDIPDLSESLDEMKYLETFVQNATGANPVQQGTYAPPGTPLGEVQLSLQEAKGRTQSISKFYTPAWKQRATKFLKLIEAGKDKLDAVKIYKKGRNTDNIHAREISPNDWMTKSGYQVKVWSQDEKNTQDKDALTKLNTVYINMMDNPKLKEVYQRKLLEWADVKPEDLNEIMDYEKKKLTMQPNMGNNGVVPNQPGQPTQQMQPQLPVKNPLAI